MVIAWIVWSVLSDGFQREDLYKREFNGPIIKAEISTKGFYVFAIDDRTTATKLEYYLHMARLITENQIEVGDSVSKESRESIIHFYKKRDGAFEKCCEYEFGTPGY